MADGRDSTPAPSLITIFPWIRIFRCFQVALDPRKLFVAAAGILVAAGHGGPFGRHPLFFFLGNFRHVALSPVWPSEPYCTSIS